MSSRQQHLLEHIQQYGVEQLPDAELLALVLCKGTAKENEKVLKRIQTLLSERGGVTGLLRTDIGELLQFELDAPGAARLHALMELARRLTRPASKGYQIASADDVVALVAPEMRYLDHEEIRVLLLDTKNTVLANLRMYKGTINSSVLRVAELLRPAITRNCPNILICHNHPSGDSTPSNEDIEVTQQVVKAARVLDIEVLDHIIIGNPGFVSLKQKLSW